MSSAGEPMLLRAMRAVASLAPTPLCVVVGHQAREVEAARARRIPRKRELDVRASGRATRDRPRRAMRHAALPRDFAGDILITYGDLPMLSPATLTAFRAAHRAANSQSVIYHGYSRMMPDPMAA